MSEEKVSQNENAADAADAEEESPETLSAEIESEKPDGPLVNGAEISPELLEQLPSRFRKIVRSSLSIRGSIPTDPDVAKEEYKARVEVSKHSMEVALADIVARKEESATRLAIYKEEQNSGKNQRWFGLVFISLIATVVIGFSLYLIAKGQTALGTEILKDFLFIATGFLGGYGIASLRKKSILEND